MIISPDTIDEANETFFVNLSNAMNATITDAQGVGTITDDDGAPTASITKDNTGNTDPTATAEGNIGTTASTFTVMLSNPSSQPTTVTVQAGATGDSAKLGEDYTFGTIGFTNVATATGVTASQSSTAFGGDASRAIDGSTDGVYGDNHVSHTGLTPAAIRMLHRTTANCDRIGI